MRDLSLHELLKLDPTEVSAVLDTLPEEVVAALLAEMDQVTVPHLQEKTPLLPHQKPPPEGWSGWVFLGGRGAGKTYASARFTADLARTTPGLRARIIVPTLSDAVNGVVYDPQSGILAYDPTATYKSGGEKGSRVEWPNGSTVWCVGTPTLRDVDRLRALTNIDLDVFEEAAANPVLAEAVQQANLSRRGTRLRRPIWIATTTPRVKATIREWLKDPNNAITRATTHDNPYTPDAYRTYAESLRGTRMYKQEVMGELLDDVEGALWSLADIERSYFVGDRDKLIDSLVKVRVGVDPPSGPGTCGIVVVGKDDAGKLYVLDDYSIEDPTPHQWATRASAAAAEYGALIVAEVNQGGRMVSDVLRRVDPSLPIKTVHASKGKATRAEPVALLWESEEQRAALAPAKREDLAELVKHLTEWVPGEYSPDPLDAMVWAATDLLDKRPGQIQPPPSRSNNVASVPASFSAALRGGR